jgi:hypothetical protein
LFPPTLSEGIKKKLYFMSAQTTWDWASHLDEILPAAKPITMKLARYPVGCPDVPVISSVVNGLSLAGCSPFPELVEFRFVSVSERLWEHF